MAFTLEQYEKLQDAIAQGALKVKYADKEVEYRSLNEMIRTLKLMGDSLGLNGKNNGRKLAAFSKGINNGCTDDERWIS